MDRASQQKPFDDIDLRRLVNNLVRIGTIEALDLEAARCKVNYGRATTAWLPWLAGRAGADRAWWAPSVGEQVLLLSPGGDLAQACVLCAIYSNTHAAPSSSGAAAMIEFSDGAKIEYDAHAHALKAEMPGGGTALVKADAGITLDGPTTVTGPLTCNGKIDAAGDITSDGEVADHVGNMNATIRGKYNDHDHAGGVPKPTEKME